jgi:hypothetical protein
MATLHVFKNQFFDANGVPLSGGKIYSYAAGTSTAKSTYTDSTGSTPNTNPTILNSRGEASLWLSGMYKIVLTDSLGATVWTVDNVANDAYDASQVIYTPSGGVATTVSAELRNVRYITDYFANGTSGVAVVGDGALTTSSGQPCGTGTGTNNYLGIMAAHDAIVATGKPGVLVIPPGIFRCDTGLKINCAFVTLDFRSGILDFTNIGNTNCVQIYSTAQYKNQRWAIGNGDIYGPIALTHTTSVGFFYESNSGGVGSADIAETSATGINLYQCGTSIKVGNNAYLNTHTDCNFLFSLKFFDFPAGATNSGVTWAFNSCRFLNGVNGFSSSEATANIELNNCGIVTTDGYTFNPEAGYFTMNGGTVEVTATGGSQFIYNNNIGTPAKNSVTCNGVNLLFKDSTTKSFIELNSVNSYVTIVGGHVAVAAGAVMMKGTGSGCVTLVNMLADGSLDPISSNSLGAGIKYSILDPYSGNLSTNGAITSTGAITASGGLVATVASGGSVFALSGANNNQVSINATPTKLVNSAGVYLVLVKDNTLGGAALVMVDAGSGLATVISTTMTAVSFSYSAGLNAATTGGTTTRTMIILAMRV